MGAGLGEQLLSGPPDPSGSSTGPSPLDDAHPTPPGPEGVVVGRTVVAIGADLVDIDRIRGVIERQPSFVDRVYTAGERDYCLLRNDPAERFAARFAAKEAVLKVLGTGLGGADFTDIEVIRLETGQPTLRVTGRAAARAAQLGISGWLITLSHSDHLAQAFVAGLGSSAGDGIVPRGSGPDR